MVLPMASSSREGYYGGEGMVMLASVQNEQDGERERESERQSERERERERERESSHFGSSSKGGPGAGGIRPASGVLAPTPALLQT